jgi:CRISPR-associated protein Cmr3
MSKILQITLKPHSTFFFGNERHFSSGEKGVNYLVNSNYFPQQTGILGLLRQLALEATDNLPITNKEKAKATIGKHSFDAVEKNEQNFEYIKRLSPVFLMQNNAILLPLPLEFTKNKEKNALEPIEYTTISGTASYDTALETTTIPNISNKNYYKNGLFQGFVNSQNGAILDANEIFQATTRTGIIKKKTGKIDEANAYYKQTSLKMKDKKAFCYTFCVEIDDAFDLESQTVWLGGERSSFAITVLEKDKIKQNLFDDLEKIAQEGYAKMTAPSNNSERVVLLSPTLPSEDFEQYLTFSLAQTVDFRNLKSSIETQNFHHVSFEKNIKGVERAAKFNLLQAGSVLFASDMEKLKKTLTQEANFRNIGYNQFITLL